MTLSYTPDRMRLAQGDILGTRVKLPLDPVTCVNFVRPAPLKLNESVPKAKCV
jgi:hypothetical protein